MKMHAQIVALVLILLAAFAAAGESQVVPINIAYATTSGIRLPLWIAEEAKLYDKYKLDAKLINIPSGNTAISALVSGEVDIISGSGSASIVAAGRGLPVVIVGSFGSTTYKLVANPGVRDLRGKIVGTSRIGATTDFALRRVIQARSDAGQRREDSRHRYRRGRQAHHADASGAYGWHDRQPGEHPRR